MAQMILQNMISTAFKTPTKKALSCHSFFVHWNEGTKTTQEKSTRFKVLCLLSKLIFIKNLGTRISRKQGSARTSIHLSNPNICKLMNILHLNLSIGQLCHLFVNSKILTKWNLKAWRCYEGRVGKTRRCYVISNRKHPESWNIYFCSFIWYVPFSWSPFLIFPFWKNKIKFYIQRHSHFIKGRLSFQTIQIVWS